MFVMQGIGTEDYFIWHFFKTHRLKINVHEITHTSLREICKSATQFNGRQNYKNNKLMNPWIGTKLLLEEVCQGWELIIEMSNTDIAHFHFCGIKKGRKSRK